MNLKKEIWVRDKLGNVSLKAKKIDYKKQSGTFNYIDIGSIDSELKKVSVIQEIDWQEASSRARQVVQMGDTLFSTVRVNLERIAFLDSKLENTIASTGFTVIRSNGRTIPEYLFYSVSAPNFIARLVQLQKGTAYPAITDRIVFDQEIPLPPLEEQKQIAALFQSIDEAIAQTEAQEGNLLKTKRQLLRELFSSNKEFGSYLKPVNYEKVTFWKLAEHISKRVEPSQTDLEIYVGLEHLDPDNLKIERQGIPADVKGTKLLIRKGDIIFGKRRAYQRKVAVSHFDGICSAHSMVLRAKEKNINKAFLPYFMQSDEFMERAVQISEGSLSPTIKWKVLENQEFEIPKLEYQPQLVEVFESFDKLISELRIQKETLKKLKHKLLDEILG